MEPATSADYATRLNIVLVVLGVGILLNLIFAVAAGLVAKSKERSVPGWLILGLFFGLFAFLLSLCVPKSGESFGAGNVVAIVLLVGAPMVIVPCLGILGAIAVPNFLESKTRAKVARAKSEMRNLAANLETYEVDNDAYPPEETPGKVARAKSEMRNLAVSLEMYYVDNDAYPPEETFPAPLTTPIAYTNKVPWDPFTNPPRNYGYRVQPVNNQEGWVLWSVGPDLTDDDGEIEYDLRNGEKSGGDIIRYADR